jgi:type II secretory pathway pseudopilin PulG
MQDVGYLVNGMSTDVPILPAKKKISVFWWIGAVALLLLVLFFVQLFGPSPKIVVSKQTTYVTEPLLPSGLPNYEEFLRQKLREGVTFENNAAVLLAPALWTKDIKDEQAELIVAELGLKEMPSSQSAMQSMYGEAMNKRVLAWLKPQFTKSDGSGVTPEPEAVIDEARAHPWTSQQLPPIAEWVEANQKPLDMIVEASRRPRYYWPGAELLDDKQDMLVTSVLPNISTMRNGARGLELRALRSIDEGHLPEAWQDILALYRLSDLMTHYSTLVEQLVAMAIRSIANHAAQELLSSPGMTKDLAHQIRDDLAALRPVATTADSINRVERLMTLDAVVQIKTKGFNTISGLTGEDTASPVDLASIDWNTVLEKINATYDDLFAAMQQPDSEQRARALKDFEQQLNAEQAEARSPGTWAAALISRSARSALVGKIVVGMLLPAMQAANTAEERTRATFALTTLAAALAEYRAEHGKYPVKLDDLTPSILATVPSDLYHAKPYIYRRIDDGYLLYTAGSNGNDDGGSNEILRVSEGREVDEMDLSEGDAEGPPIPKDADDFAIRMPMPQFKLPKPVAE